MHRQDVAQFWCIKKYKMFAKLKWQSINFYSSKMNVVLNPFSPRAGTPPPALVERKVYDGLVRISYK